MWAFLASGSTLRLSPGGEGNWIQDGCRGLKAGKDWVFLLRMWPGKTVNLLEELCIHPGTRRIWERCPDIWPEGNLIGPQEGLGIAAESYCSPEVGIGMVPRPVDMEEAGISAPASRAQSGLHWTDNQERHQKDSGHFCISSETCIQSWVAAWDGHEMIKNQESSIPWSRW